MANNLQLLRAVIHSKCVPIFYAQARHTDSMHLLAMPNALMKDQRQCLAEYWDKSASVT